MSLKYRIVPCPSALCLQFAGLLLLCYEHLVFAYYERITRCSYHAKSSGRMHTKNMRDRVVFYFPPSTIFKHEVN